MDRGKDGVRARGQNRAGFDGVPVRSFPTVPQAGESEKSLIAHPDVIRLLAAFPLLPLEEPVCGNQTAMPFEGGAEGRLLPCGFAAGVPGSDYRVFGPGRDQSPFEQGDFTFSPGCSPDGGNGLGRSDVIPWGEIARQGDVEHLRQQLAGCVKGEPPAHGGSSARGILIIAQGAGEKPRGLQTPRKQLLFSG